MNPHTTADQGPGPENTAVCELSQATHTVTGQSMCDAPATRRVRTEDEFGVTESLLCADHAAGYAVHAAALGLTVTAGPLAPPRPVLPPLAVLAGLVLIVGALVWHGVLPWLFEACIMPVYYTLRTIVFTIYNLVLLLLTPITELF